MNFTFTLFVALLFVVLSPGVLLSLPPKGSLLTKVLVHSVVFAVVFYLTAPMAWQVSTSVEGFRPPPSSSGTLMTPNTSLVVPMDLSDKFFSTGVKKSGPRPGTPTMFGYAL
jgi:hypothetical protein